jgi:UPF0716 family protein affecting phage T7 exclusion
MSALRDYRTIWRAAFVQRQPRAMQTAAVLIPLVLAGSAVFGLVSHDWENALHVAAGLSAVVLMFMWVMFFVPSVALMNTPANARLVPRMHRRLVVMMVASWVLSAAGGAVILDWHAAPLVALYMIGMSTARGGLQTVGGAMVALSVSWRLVLHILPVSLAQFLMTVPGFLCSCLALALLGACIIRLILPAGGEGHYRRRQRQAATIVRLESMGRVDSNYAPKRSLSLYAIALRNACRSGDPRRLLLHAAGPGGYWTSAAFAAGVMLAVAVVVKVLLVLFASADTREAVAQLGWTFPLALLFIHFSIVEQCKMRIAAAKNEEALMRLAARGPATGELNRVLAAGLVRNTLLSWFVVAGVVMIVTALSGASLFILGIEASLCAVGLMPSVAWILRDYARQDNGGSIVRFVLAVVAVVILVVAVGVGFAYIRAVGAPVALLLALSSNVVGGAFAVTRWKKMLAAPVAFPAGRLA